MDRMRSRCIEEGGAISDQLPKTRLKNNFSGGGSADGWLSQDCKQDEQCIRLNWTKHAVFKGYAS